ncbi:M56 family metallopeptidase [Singulisphaera sp. PoT]|uniref:M56 family metallopeptidase n=1 Tax=Singulisphaera sp. PoT TaxID=3411797 RepID=UPI003BF60D65
MSILKDHPLLHVLDAQASPPPRSRLDTYPRVWVIKVGHLVTESHVSRLFTFVYIAGVSCTLGWLLFGYWGIGWLARRSATPSAATLSLYASVVDTDDGIRRPALRITTRVRRPVILGLFRETILIPESLDNPSMSDQLRLSLLHELAHSKGRDPWFSLASEFAQALWFFVPTIWWIRAQMRIDQEFLADRHAASGFGQNPSYASSLVNLAAPAKALAGPATTAGTAALQAKPMAAAMTGSALFQRILMLIQCPFPVESRPPRWWDMLLACALIGGILGTTSLSFQLTRNPMATTQISPKPSQPLNKYKINKLTVKPDPRDTRGRGTVTELPFRLPERFHLFFELWGSHESIENVHALGIPLHVMQPVVSPGAAIEEWHPVNIIRDEQGLTVHVGAEQIIVDPSLPLTRWLSFETPPNTVTHIENLIVTW